MAINHKENIALIGLVGTTMLSGALFTLPPALADDVVDTITITVPSSCSISSTGENSHTAEINNGQYDSSIGETTIKAFCNDNEGFAIYAIGYTDNELGKNVLTNATLGATHDIVTGTAISGSTSNWAMKLSTIISPTPAYPIIIAGSSEDLLKQTGDADFSNFTNVPDVYKKVAYRTSATDINPEGSNTAEGSTLKTTYQAYISPTQAAGAYTGQVKYTMVHPANEQPLQPQTSQSGKICYYANASSALGTMGCQDVAAEVMLLASNFSREGYGFAGWSDKFDYATNTNAHFYGPMETITIPDTSIYTGEGKGLSLYAVWIKSAGSLQDQSKVAQLCGTNGTGGSLTTAPTNGTANLSSVSALTDQRDNQTYAIAKLADDKCWMIENLRLEADDTKGQNRFDSSITNASLAQGYGTSATYGNFGGLAGAESTYFSDSTTANSLYYIGTQSGDATIDIGTTNYPGYRMPRYNNLNTQSRAQNSPNTNSFSDNNTDGGMYSYGNYYTWHAAMTNTTHYSGPTATDADSKTSETVNTSLCPTGWRLPYGRSTGNGTLAGGFYNLNYKINNDSNVTNSTANLKLRSFPNNFLYSGYFGTSSAFSRGSNGYYWSSTAYGSSYSYSLYLRASYVSPGTDYNNKYIGYSIRCVSGS